MKKYFIEYAGQSKEIAATSYSIGLDFMYFYRGLNLIFAVNTKIIESVTVSTEEISYKDIDLLELITHNFMTEVNIEDSTIADADSYRIALDIILGIDNKFNFRGNYNKNFYPTIKDAKNKLAKDFICEAIKTHIKNLLNNKQ